MKPTPTAIFVETLQKLKAGELSQLRSFALRPLDQSLAAFDLFAGLWWPLREKSERAPRREVAWLVAKLYAACPLPLMQGKPLASTMGAIAPREERQRRTFQTRFDQLLSQSLAEIEPSLRWALARLREQNRAIDWVTLADDLSIWQRPATRQRWAHEFLQANQTEKEIVC